MVRVHVQGYSVPVGPNGENRTGRRHVEFEQSKQ